MIYGYARVSTKSQKTDGNSLDYQTTQLKMHGAVKIYEDSMTGTKTDRPGFLKLLEVLQTGDTLIVTKLDRFARSIQQGSLLVTDLIDKGIRVHILNIGVLDNTPSGKLIRNIFFSFAEFERDMILERTREGKQIARQKPDFKEGRPQKYTDKQIKHALALLIVNGGIYSYNEVAELTGISKSTLIRHNKKCHTAAP